MNKNLDFFNYSNYLVFFLFISLMLFDYITKENFMTKKTKKIIETNIEKIEQITKTEQKNIYSELDFKDFIEIKEEFEKQKQNKTPIINKTKIIPLETNKKIQSIPHSNLKNKITEEKKIIFDFTPLKNEPKKNNQIRNTFFNKEKEAISLGKSILETKTKFDIYFKWPVKTNMHNLIYKKMLTCLNAKTVILGDDRVFYSQKGILDKISIRNNYSPILRLPNYSTAKLENSILKNIKNKYPQSTKGKLIRLFDKNVDAYILGQFKILAKSKFSNLKKISGVYSILDNKLFLINLNIDNQKIDGKIDLSTLNKGC